LKLFAAKRRAKYESIFALTKMHYKYASIVIAQEKDEEEAKALRNILRHQLVMNAVLLTRVRKVRNLRVIALPLYYITCVSVYAGLGAASSVLGTGASFLAVLTTIAYFAAISRLTRKFANRNAVALFSAIVTYGIFIAIVGSGNNWHEFPVAGSNGLRDFVADLFTALTISIAALRISEIICETFIALITTAIMSRHSNIVVIDSLLEVLAILDSRARSFANLGTKELICGTLQFTANYVENGVIRSLSITDPAVRKALQIKFSSSAAYLRDMQIQVVLAKEGTKDDLTYSISNYVKMIALGFYQSLPVSTLETMLETRKRRLLGFSRTFIVALIPVSCLEIAQHVGLVLSPDFTSWAFVVTLAWAAITLVSAIDPLYKSRLQDVRDFMTAIRGKDK
jgi:hypothetical protein